MAIASVQHDRGVSTAPPYRMSIEMAGFLTILLGAWGGIVPYVGPQFGFSADGSASWTWNLTHGMLFLLPGAVAVFCGLMMMVEGLSSSPARHRVLQMLGFLAAAAGAWFIAGPFAWPVLTGITFFHATGSPLLQFAYWMGYSLGVGGLLMGLGAFVMGRPRVFESVAVL